MFSSVLPKNIETSAFLNEGKIRRGPDRGTQLPPEKVLRIRLASGPSSWKRARRRAFIDEASRMQTKFDGAFSKYMEARSFAASLSENSSSSTLLAGYTGGLQTCTGDVQPSRALQEFEVLADDMEESWMETMAEDESCTSPRSRRFGIDMQDTKRFVYWPDALKPSAKPKKTGKSLRTAMALPPLPGESRYEFCEYRDVGLSERSLTDRTPRTEPECTRPAPKVRSPRTEASDRESQVTFDEQTLWTPFYGMPSMGMASRASSFARLPTSSKLSNDEGHVVEPPSHFFDPLEVAEGFSWKSAPLTLTKPSPLKTRGA